MTHVEAHSTAPEMLAAHGRRSAETGTRRLPQVVWPVVAMVAMVPVLAFLLIALFT